MNESNQNSTISIELLIPNKYQPRKEFNEESLKELAKSIKEYGILNPILVRKNMDKFEIIAGERRLRAAKLAGLTEVPVIIKDITDSKMAELALIENLQRENISPIEEAQAYAEILKLSSKTEQELSEIIGKSQPFISNKLRLLKLPENIKNALIQRKISERHARSLMTVTNSEKQAELLNRIINEKLTVKELDTIINEKEINEQEIKNAIDDIMKTLNMSEEEKEEKESDNMNNGNFFPNMSQNIPQGGEPATLNSMNMQTMGGMLATDSQPMMTPQPEIAPNPIPDFSAPTTPMVENSVPAPNSVQDTPLFGGATLESSSTPSMELPQEQPMMTPQSEIAPNPIPDFSAPATPTVENSVPAPNPVQDTPLFGGATLESSPTPSMELPQEQPPIMTETITMEPIYDIPVSTPTVENQINQQDKLTQIQQLLNSNGIEYKSYSNETSHCIIIEI